MREVLEARNLLAINNPNYNATRLHDSIKTHLTDLKDPYRTWYQRVAEHYQEQWKTQQIDQAIFLSTLPCHLHEKVLLAMAAFWHPEICSFLLPTAPIGPTLMDVAMIAHLPIVGEDPVMGARDGQESNSDYLGWSLTDVKEWGWTKFLINQQGTDGTPVTDREHIAFLLFWLCKYVVVSPSKCVLPSHLDLAIHIASGRFFSLGTLFLANLFEGLSRVSVRLTDKDGKKLDNAASGPFWFLELWFRLYFPDAFQLGHPHVAPTLENSLGVALNRLCLGRNNLQASDPIITAMLTDNRNENHFYPHKMYIGYASGVFWPFPVPSPLSQPNPLPHPTYPFSWDVALKPRSLFTSLPGPIAHPHLTIQSPDGRAIFDAIAPYISQLINYITSNSYIPYKPSPTSVESFREWWSVTWALISPDKDRLLGILLPPPAITLGANPLTNTQRNLITQGNESGAPQRKRRAFQTQTIPPFGDSQPSSTKRLSGRPPIRSRPRPGVASARATAQPTSRPTKTMKPPTDPLPEPEPPIKRRAPNKMPSSTEHATIRVSSPSEATASDMNRLPHVASAVSDATVPDTSNQRATDLEVADPGAAALEVADPGAADPPLAAGRQDEEPLHVQPRGLLPELPEIPSSDSETSVNLGPRSKPQRPLEATDESAIGIPNDQPSKLMAILAPSTTIIRPEGYSDLALLSAVLIPTDVRAIIAQAVDQSFPDLGSDLLDNLLQGIGGLLFQLSSESAAAPILHYLMERLSELRNEVLFAQLLTAETPLPDLDRISLEASLTKTKESIQQAVSRLEGLNNAKAQIKGSIQQKEAELKALHQERSVLEGHINDEQRLIDRYQSNAADLDQELKIHARSQLIKQYQSAANNRRRFRSEDKWSQIKLALGSLL
ncbi:uncharacterized protein LOC127252491 [Andrographis paniculata]|uniref:uncharacterized protein LOC127252491 n=1 Tax=Andrographis paniculata TaxID=175694 RepID=UPI0021E829C2|nr:uncharacterized protein LOC127252491 [Andrographis paniculata]